MFGLLYFVDNVMICPEIGMAEYSRDDRAPPLPQFEVLGFSVQYRTMSQSGTKSLDTGEMEQRWSCSFWRVNLVLILVCKIRILVGPQYVMALEAVS